MSGMSAPGPVGTQREGVAQVGAAVGLRSMTGVLGGIMTDHKIMQPAQVHVAFKREPNSRLRS